MNIHTQTHSERFWNNTEKRFDFNFTFTFNSREQYLEFRRHWKTSYASLSQSIRNLKALVSATQRQREHAGKLQSELCLLRSQATFQLLMLRAAKREACRQYLAHKENVS
jgi:hypothetical protein